MYALLIGGNQRYCSQLWSVIWCHTILMYVFVSCWLLYCRGGGGGVKWIAAHFTFCIIIWCYYRRCPVLVLRDQRKRPICRIICVSLDMCINSSLDPDAADLTNIIFIMRFAIFVSFSFLQLLDIRPDQYWCINNKVLTIWVTLTNTMACFFNV